MVHYLLSWGAPTDRLFDIDVRFIAPADTPRLLLPAWRPGRYLIQNYAANVREWSAGEARIWKDGKTSWRVDARAGEEVVVRYRYYAGVLDAGSSFLDDDEAYFNGANLFMLVEGLRSEEHLLTIAAPAHWRIETQLPREESGAFLARDYDHLIDSPTIAAAAMTRHSFLESDARFHLVFRGDEEIDTEQFVEPIRAIVRSQAELFGGLPFAEYRFLYHLRDRWHGVEHEDSSSILLRRNALLGAGPGDDGFDHTLSITSHELFHAWNVKRMVPAKFAPYDYWRETPTRLLWAMEGLTSYYGELTLVRCGLWSVDRYLRHLAHEIQTLEALPARLHLSLAQASFDAWLSDP
ncbi:MAG TPA: M61 family peptidase, partial [Thermoanaerobaculia bacterium]